MTCPNITNLIFSPTGKRAINEIKRKQNLANVLASVLAGSVLLEIFVGNGALGSANNIKKKDWDVWAKAMRSVPIMLSKEINRISQFQLLDHTIDTKERQFWEGVVYGCK